PLRTHGRAAALPGQPAASRPDHGRDQQGKSYHGFAHWLSFGNNGVLANNDPCEQEKLIKLNTLLANLAIFHNTRDIMHPESRTRARQRRSTMRALRVGVVGYSGQKFDEDQALAFIQTAHDTITTQYPQHDVTIVSGLTNVGIPAISVGDCRAVDPAFHTASAGWRHRPGG
ncbi:Tn3 family transposase, partial [Actinomadura coerulea]